jgi:hypothetical protein
MKARIAALAIVAVLVEQHGGNAIAFQKLTPEQRNEGKQQGEPVEGVVLDARDQSKLRVELFDAARSQVIVNAVDVELVADQVSAPEPSAESAKPASCYTRAKTAALKKASSAK